LGPTARSPINHGETKLLPARYSFTFVKQGEIWMIVDHHSSAMPETPQFMHDGSRMRFARRP
jgi:hypothetical protein